MIKRKYSKNDPWICFGTLHIFCNKKKLATFQARAKHSPPFSHSQQIMFTICRSIWNWAELHPLGVNQKIVISIGTVELNRKRIRKTNKKEDWKFDTGKAYSFHERLAPLQTEAGKRQTQHRMKWVWKTFFFVFAKKKFFFFQYGVLQLIL